MAICGTDLGDSDWVGPLTFTTTIQTFYDIDCESGLPVNVNYCYDNNDTTAWTFNSSNDFPLEIVFNSGTIEAIWDDITIYDGADNTGTVLFNNNTSQSNINDLTGLVVESTSTSIYVEVNSCLLYTSPSPRDRTRSRMPSSA